MIQVSIGCDPAGFIRHLRSTGHDARREGSYSPACALVSHALRSFGLVAGRQVGISLRGAINAPGSFEMTIGDIAPEREGWYCGASELLIQEFQDAVRNFPGRIELKIHTV